MRIRPPLRAMPKAPWCRAPRLSPKTMIGVVVSSTAGTVAAEESITVCRGVVRIEVPTLRYTGYLHDARLRPWRARATCLICLDP